jgi:hypothetical protein
MAGHITELLWRDASDETNRFANKWLEMTVRVEELFQEYQLLWAAHGGDDDLVAAQLHGVDVVDLTAAHQSQTLSLKGAVGAIHTVFVAADLDAIREMTQGRPGRPPS